MSVLSKVSTCFREYRTHFGVSKDNMNLLHAMEALGVRRGIAPTHS
jgi:hypothetical protein